MKSKKIKLNKNRVLLSDILPYELPIIFSNRHFLHLVNKYGIKFQYENNKIIYGEKTPILLKKFLDKQKEIWYTIPFQYKIKHNELNSRSLTIIHPFHQIQMVSFYDKYKELILYLCNKSHFSIRKPVSIAKRYYYKDNLHKKSLSDEDSCIEQYDQEYESLKSFFIYKRYNNIYKFYDDYLFNRCEKKYNFLLKLDVSKCFDSIYTHSLSWAIYGKNFIKEHIHKEKESFSGNFDRLMQYLNYRETHGIVIGPEFSRIFAEIILQKIDVDLEKKLKEENLSNKQDYEIYRYVDDYFIFYNEDKDKELIKSNLSATLANYKLFLNEKKMLIYKKPIITNISKAKKQIKSLLKENIIWEFIKKEEGNNKIKANITALTLISKFKIIISNAGVEYKDVLNQTFAIVDNIIFRFFNDINKINSKNKLKEEDENQIYRFISGVIEFISFIYSVSPKISTTIRLSSILKKIIYFYKRKNSNKSYKLAIFDVIYNNVILMLKKNKSERLSYVETSYLLIVLKELGKNYYLSENLLSTCFGMEKNKEKADKDSLNYLSIMTILFYIQDKNLYKNTKNYIIEIIKERLKSKKFKKNSCEDILLLLDTISCPYIEDDIKKSILSDLEYTSDDIDNIIKNKQSWFISWGRNFNLKKALDAKKSNEVY